MGKTDMPSTVTKVRLHVEWIRTPRRPPCKPVLFLPPSKIRHPPKSHQVLVSSGLAEAGPRPEPAHPIVQVGLRGLVLWGRGLGGLVTRGGACAWMSLKFHFVNTDLRGFRKDMLSDFSVTQPLSRIRRSDGSTCAFACVCVVMCWHVCTHAQVDLCGQVSCVYVTKNK